MRHTSKNRLIAAVSSRHTPHAFCLSPSGIRCDLSRYQSFRYRMSAGCAGKTVRSPENACHTWAPYNDEALYKSTFTFTYLYLSFKNRQICNTRTHDKSPCVRVASK